jgi:O-acetyl-ADP-ribose deacetylase (regulator of RNase III)
MPTIVEGNLLDAQNSIIIHQVNCQGVMGSGIAKQIRDKWPQVYESYKNKIEEIKDSVETSIGFYTPDFCLGEYSITEKIDGNYIVNLFGQLNYGRDKVQYTSYSAVFHGLMKLSYRIWEVEGEMEKKDIAIPYGIGCGLGGGDWKKVSSIIEYVFPDAKIYKLKQNA